MEKIRKEIWLEKPVFEQVKIKAKASNVTSKAYIEALVIRDIRGNPSFSVTVIKQYHTQRGANDVIKRGLYKHEAEVLTQNMIEELNGQIGAKNSVSKFKMTGFVVYASDEESSSICDIYYCSDPTLRGTY